MVLVLVWCFGSASSSCFGLGGGGVLGWEEEQRDVDLRDGVFGGGGVERAGVVHRDGQAGAEEGRVEGGVAGVPG